MNKFLLLILCYFIFISCSKIENIDNTKKKSLDKEFTISAETKLKTKK